MPGGIAGTCAAERWCWRSSRRCWMRPSSRLSRLLGRGHAGPVDRRRQADRRPSRRRSAPAPAIVRAMPNTPAAIGRGVTVLCANAARARRSAAWPRPCWRRSASTAWIEDEELLHAVTAISGSGPAYVFLLIEALAAAGVAARPARGRWRCGSPAARSPAAASWLVQRPDRRPPSCGSTSPAPAAPPQAALEVLMGEQGLPALVDPRPGGRGRSARASWPEGRLDRGGSRHGRGRRDRPARVAALALIAERGWRGFCLAELARRAGVPWAASMPSCPAVPPCCASSARRLDAAMLGADRGRARRHVAARAAVRADHAPPRRHGALPPARLARDRQGARRRSAGDRGLRPVQSAARLADWLVDAAGRRGRRGRPAGAGTPWLRSMSASSTSGSTTIRPTSPRTLAELDRRLGQAEELPWLAGTAPLPAPRRRGRADAAPEREPNEPMTPIDRGFPPGRHPRRHRSSRRRRTRARASPPIGCASISARRSASRPAPPSSSDSTGPRTLLGRQVAAVVNFAAAADRQGRSPRCWCWAFPTRGPRRAGRPSSARCRTAAASTERSAFLPGSKCRGRQEFRPPDRSGGRVPRYTGLARDA